MTKIQLTLTDQEADILGAKAAQLGYNITRFIKYLITKEAVGTLDPEDNLPTFKMSKRLEEIGLKALADHRAGKTHVVKNIEDLGNL